MLHKLNVQQLFGLFILGLICFMPFHASAQSDFTHSVVKLTSTSAKITFTPNNTMQWVIIHFTVNRGQQQNVNMVNNAGTWEHSLTGLVEGDSIDYSFTYFNGTAATDSLWFNAPFGTPAATSTSAPQPFSHSLVTVNATSAKLLFTPDNPMTWVEVHYKVNRGEQQNVQMTKNGATWEYTITGLAASNTIDYFFTYFDTAATDSPWFSTRFGGTPVATATPGTPVATATPGPTATTPAAASATVDDFEIATLPLGTDSFGNNVGFVIFGGENPTLSLTTVLTETAMARPGQGASNKILKIDYNVSTFGGFTHAFENATLNSWVSQNWKSYTGVSFWLYGANTGKPIQFEIFDNRGSGSTKDTAERYINKVTDNFTGWKKIEIPFTAFTRGVDYQPIGAPNDGLGLTEVWAYAINLPGGTGAQTTYIDDVVLYGGSTTAPTATPSGPTPTPAAVTTTVDDFEIATLPLGTDSFGNNVGFVIFGGENPALSLTSVLTGAAMARPGQGASNKILKIDYNVTSFGGFTHAFENATLNSWVSQNWKSYTGVSFWLYGANTGKPIQFEIFDNRGSGSTKDTAERYINKVTDNFTGWKKIEIPFTAFTRNIDYQPIGAPNDGLGLTEVWAYALNLPGGTGAQTAYIDDVFLYGGSTTAPTATPTPSGPTPTATPSGPTATPAPSNWVLEWSDEFEGAANTGLNTSNWLYDLGHSYPGGANNWGTGEIAEMTNSLDNVYLDGNGNLAIKPIRTGNNWTSGRIETQRLDFEAPAGGKMAVEGRIQVPNVTGAAAQGYWPAFWMLGGPFRGIYTNWPEVGEIDILENVNGTNTLYSTFHCGVAPGGPCNEFTGIGGNISGSIPTLQEAFHTYRMEFDRTVSPEQIRFYLDGKLFHTVKADQVDATTWKNATNHGFFIILNVAMGGNWPGLPTANTVSGIPMLVDYIKVYYSYSPTAPTPTPTITPTPGKVAATVIPPTGGSLASSDNKTTVQFPNGVLNESVNLSITVLTKTTYVTTGFKIGSYVYQIIATNNQGVRVTQFNQPFSIVFNYQDSDWAGLGEESALKPYYWSPSEKRWVNIMPCTGCSQDMENNKLTIQLNHLTDFALLIATTQRIYLPVIVK